MATVTALISASMLCILSFCLAANITFSNNTAPLRHHWANHSLRSPEALRIDQLQHECTPNMHLLSDVRHGMGFGIVTVSYAFCVAMQRNATLYVSRDFDWIWNDKHFCSQERDDADTIRMLDCYFGRRVTPCAPSLSVYQHLPQINYSHTGLAYCHTDSWYFQFIEYLFSQINPRLVHLAEQAAYTVFGPAGSPAGMISVHIRWGDKGDEMGGLVEISSYIEAVDALIMKHSLNASSNHPSGRNYSRTTNADRPKVHIFIITEDALALEAFQQHARPDWVIYKYSAAISPLVNVHAPMQDAFRTQGAMGLQSMIALLLSMESRYYVLTTSSNWSMLMKAVKSGILDLKCGNCTDMIDLKSKIDAKIAQLTYKHENLTVVVGRNKSILP